jgi:minor histocompatibility antigen H13
MAVAARPTMVGADPIAAPLAHVALLLCALAPTVAVVDPNAQIVAVSALSVVAGAHRSVRPASEGSGEVMTKSDAQKFPLLGSCVLFGAFLAFKFLPKRVLDLCATAYFGALGVVAMSAILTPVVHKFAFGGRELVSHELFSVPEMKWVNEERWINLARGVVRVRRVLGVLHAGDGERGAVVRRADQATFPASRRQCDRGC